jgi:uncharacterized protein YecA (UPF0149 family)
MGVKGDIPSMLQKIAALEQENGALKDEVQKKETRVSQLTQKTQEEMRKVLETQITEWLSRLKAENNEKKIEEFQKGLGRIVDATAEDSGVWQVACLASAAHNHNLTELERLRVENETLSQKVNGGRFSDIDERVDKKRKADVIGKDTVEEKDNLGIWGELETFFKKDSEIA